MAKIEAVARARKVGKGEERKYEGSIVVNPFDFPIRHLVVKKVIRENEGLEIDLLEVSGEMTKEKHATLDRTSQAIWPMMSEIVRASVERCEIDPAAYYNIRSDKGSPIDWNCIQRSGPGERRLERRVRRK